MRLAKLQVQELLRQEELAKANVDYYQARLRDYDIVSPIDGVVSSLMVQEGEMVNEGQPLAEVIDPDTIEVRVHLPEECLPSIETVQGASVVFGVFASEGSVPGRVRFVSPYVDSSSGTFLVKILVEAAGTKLRAGVACQVQFVERPSRSAAEPPARAGGSQ